MSYYSKFNERMKANFTLIAVYAVIGLFVALVANWHEVLEVVKSFFFNLIGLE